MRAFASCSLLVCLLAATVGAPVVSASPAPRPAPTPAPAPSPAPAPAPSPADADPSAAAPSLPPTAPWVSVDDKGTAHTVTPVLTTIDGTPTVVSAEPTTTTTALERTMTASRTAADQPQATATNGAGSFPVCHNTDGPTAPFCAPAAGSTLNPGRTYYITWDPAYFAAPNTTVIVTGNLFNATTGEVTTQAFASGTLAAAWSFYAWTVDGDLLKGAGRGGVNVSVSLSYLPPPTGPIVPVATPEPYRQPPAKAPTGPALYIGLPCVLGFVVLVVVGTCLWNRHVRRINLGNVMSRGRYGPLGGGGGQGYGVRKSRRERMGHSGRVGALHLDSKDAIRLQTRTTTTVVRDGRADDSYADSPYVAGTASSAAHRQRQGGPAPSLGLALPGDRDYHDHDDGLDDWTLASGTTTKNIDSHDRPRRDSDALGSLAGTPTEERFTAFHRPRTASGATTGNNNNNSSTGNAFRDELRRQEGLL
ncbi:hypothetical protein SPI_09100 [Niveomyces insectorum RCEF 264]|uniref:Uncharacterized protein n=1 Tax=Niveomyces insectorum RCEF 264 TaxID=1081102 RepID=A0A167MBC3_9HYPO|nr:hypothetical protein SPI_09100 [Niveomyces insectorum RCEF 264]